MWEGKGKVNPKGLLPPRASQPLPPWYQASGPRCGQLPTFEEAGRCRLRSEDAAVTAGYSGGGVRASFRDWVQIPGKGLLCVPVESAG